MIVTVYRINGSDRNVDSASMFIKGGDTIWGNATHAPDDVEGTTHTHGHFISFRAPTPEWVSSSIPPGERSTTASNGPKGDPTSRPVNEESFERHKAAEEENHHHQHRHNILSSFDPLIPKAELSPGVGNLTAEEAGTWVLEHTPNTFQRMLYTNYSYGIERDEEKLKANNLDHTKWTNPLEIQ